MIVTLGMHYLTGKSNEYPDLDLYTDMLQMRRTL